MGMWFISNRLQMQIINQQNSITTVYPPTTATTSVPPLSSFASASSISDITASSNHQPENHLSIEVCRLQMNYLDDDQLTLSYDDDRQSSTAPGTVRESPQIFDKNMLFATQKYLQKYNLFSGYNRQQQYNLTFDDSGISTSSSSSFRRILSLLSPFASPPRTFAY